MASPFPADAATDPKLPHDSLVGHIIGICSAMLIFVTLVVGARFWVRYKLVKGKAGADDWCILVAWVLAVAFDLDPINRTYIQSCDYLGAYVRCYPRHLSGVLVSQTSL